jgi:hypothetical protein
MSMPAKSLRISRLLLGAGEVARAPRRESVVGGTARSMLVQVRRVTRDRQGRRIVECWTETTGGAR